VGSRIAVQKSSAKSLIDRHFDMGTSGEPNNLAAGMQTAIVLLHISDDT
jgi:hypothetical protein